MFTTGNTTVDAIGQMHLEGNVIPHTWYENIRLESTGKPDLIAITLLSEIVYWYRPSYVKEEASGRLIGIKKKFKADALQRSYDSFVDQFGFSKKQVRVAMDRLEKLAVIRREFRTVQTNGTSLSNVLFIDLNIGLLEGITFMGNRVLPIKETGSYPQGEQGVTLQGERVLPIRETPPTRKGNTYTEITTEITNTKITTENNNNDDDDQRVPACSASKPSTPLKQNAFAFYEQNHFGALGSLVINKIDNWINDLSEPIVIYAMEKAVMNGKTTWGYVETILQDWWHKKLFTLEAIEAEDLRWKNQRIKAAQQQNRTQKTYQKPRREEVVPEWFKNRNNESSQKPIEPSEPTEPVDFEAERHKILAKLDRGHKQYEKTQKNS
ncbi:DnaD domain-containing protein [Lysinibacillus sp. NPDC093688]|uniref:DnaD domain-containing protein n=1 Tax=Lysinibacillus sp. NPDC093688 TaxID=3390577 RepID=UPI003CFEFDEB